MVRALLVDTSKPSKTKTQKRTSFFGEELDLSRFTNKCLVHIVNSVIDLNIDCGFLEPARLDIDHQAGIRARVGLALALALGARRA